MKCELSLSVWPGRIANPLKHFMLSWRLSLYLDIRKIFRKDQITYNFYSFERAFTRFLFHFSTTHPPPFLLTLLSNNMLGKHISVSALSDIAIFLVHHKQWRRDVNLIISSMKNVSKDDSRANTMCWGSQHSLLKVPQLPLLLPTESKTWFAVDISRFGFFSFLSSHWWHGRFSFLPNTFTQYFP